LSVANNKFTVGYANVACCLWYCCGRLIRCNWTVAYHLTTITMEAEILQLLIHKAKISSQDSVVHFLVDKIGCKQSCDPNYYALIG